MFASWVPAGLQQLFLLLAIYFVLIHCLGDGLGWLLRMQVSSQRSPETFGDVCASAFAKWLL